MVKIINIDSERDFVFRRNRPSEADRMKTALETNTRLNMEFARIRNNRIAQKARAKANRFNGIKNMMRF